MEKSICPACEGAPQHPNNPCAVCGTKQPVVNAEPLRVFAQECAMGAYQESELREAALRALKYATAPVSAEPVGYGVFWREKGQDCSMLKSLEADALKAAVSLGIPGASVEPVFRGAAPVAAQAQPLSHFSSSHWANQVHAHFNQQEQLEKGCKRSHPHENMSPECEALTEAARIANQAAQSQQSDRNLEQIKASLDNTDNEQMLSFSAKEVRGLLFTIKNQQDRIERFEELKKMGVFSKGVKNDV